MAPFRYYFTQIEAVKTVIWLHDVQRIRDRHDLVRFGASNIIVLNRLRADFDGLKIFP